MNTCLSKYPNSLLAGFFVLVCLCFNSQSIAQENHYVIIDSVIIEGNKHTEKFIIEREILLKKDSIYESANMDKLALLSEYQLMNTNLFIDIKVSWEEVKSQHVLIKVVLQEKWYKWIIPVFELGDRNYKEWESKGFDLNRTNYGAHINIYNFRGRRETVRLTFINGYTRHYALQYIVPFLDKSGKYGLELGSSYKLQKEIWYLTKDNKLQFYQNFKKSLIGNFENNLAFTTRRNNFTFEKWVVEYNNIRVRDTIQSRGLNPDYLLSGDVQNEFYIKHIFIHERRDNKYYPLRGFYFKNELRLGNIISDTANIELLRETIEGGLYRNIYKKLYLSGYFKFYYSNQPKPQPYYNFKAFGYSDYVRGYEQYVIDGHGFALAKVNIKIALIHRKMLKMPFKLNKKILRIPTGIYLNFYSDWGKVFNDIWRAPSNIYNNSLINTDLLGYGSGADLVFLNDKILRFEYSLNILGDQNFNLGIHKSF